MIRVQKEIVCDSCGKVGEFPKCWTAKNLRKRAKELGWRQWNAVDKCKNCARIMTHPVRKIDPQSGDVVKSYESIGEAALLNSTSRMQIQRALKSQKLHKGFIWESLL